MNNGLSNYELARSFNPNDLVSHHDTVLSSMAEERRRISVSYDLVRNEPWNEKDLALFKRKRVRPLKMGVLKSSERSILGEFIQNSFSVGFKPTSAEGTDASRIYNAVYLRDFDANMGDKEDVELVRRAWACGRSYQQIYLARHGITGQPLVQFRNLPTLAVTFAPGSMDIGARRDAPFVDVETMMSFDRIAQAFPDKFEKMLPNASRGDSQYKSVDAHAYEDTQSPVNGMFRVIERQYKLFVQYLDYFDADGNLITTVRADDADAKSEAAQGMVSKDEEGNPLFDDNGDEVMQEFSTAIRSEEAMFYAAACPTLLPEEYLYNGPAPIQCRDPRDGRLMFDIVEMYAEELEGEISGFVYGQLDAVQGLNAMVSSMLHSAKHSASQSKTADKSAFIDEAEALRFAKGHTDADAVFFTKPGMHDRAVAPVPHSQLSNDVGNSLGLMRDLLIDNSSTPPSFMGTEQKTGISNAVTSTRISQAAKQLQVLITNYRHFLRNRAAYMVNLWAQFYTAEMVLKIESQDNPEEMEYVKANWYNDALGTVENPLSEAILYDINITDAPSNRTMREKTQADIIELLKSPAMQNDPALATMLVRAWVQHGDMPSWFRNQIWQYSQGIKAAEELRAQIEAARDQSKVDLNNANIEQKNASMKSAQVKDAIALQQATTAIDPSAPQPPQPQGE